MRKSSNGARVRPLLVKALALVAFYVFIVMFVRLGWGVVTFDGCRSSSPLLWAGSARSNDMMRMPRRDFIESAPLMSSTDLSMTTRDWSGSPVVAEELRLIYCDIPKNACTTMKRLLMRVRGHRNWNSTYGGDVHDPDVNGLTSMRDLDLTRANRIMHDAASWTRLLIVRDPIARFAAAFLDKCSRVIYAKNHTRIVDGNCPLQDVDGSESADRVLAKLEQQAGQGALAAMNVHFRPQIQFCDLRRYAHSYVIIDVDALSHAMYALFDQIDIPSDTKNITLTALHEISALDYTARHRTPSQALVQEWVDEAEACVRNERPSNASACDHMIAPRLRRLYADDYELLSIV
jgi:hypothetical protein